MARILSVDAGELSTKSARRETVRDDRRVKSEDSFRDVEEGSEELSSFECRLDFIAFTSITDFVTH